MEKKKYCKMLIHKQCKNNVQTTQNITILQGDDLYEFDKCGLCGNL